MPVIVYEKLFDLAEGCGWLENTFRQNNWLNNWRDIVLPYDHFHSNTHEVLGLGKGEVTLKVGGADGLVLNLKTGDVVVMPAGVGHYALSSHTDYTFVGGYPNGLPWDLCTGAANERTQVLENLANVKLPDTDPVFGPDGPLLQLWKELTGK